jgi:hypothetical protein
LEYETSTNRRAAEQRVKGPAIGLMVIAAMNASVAVAGALYHVFQASFAPFADHGHRVPEFFSGLGGFAVSLVNLGLSVFLAWAAFEMFRLRSYPLALIACIVALVPCISPCCILGIPIGIWGLVVINDREVRTAFRS